MPILELLVWVLCAIVVGLVIHHLRRMRVRPAENASVSSSDVFETAPIGYLEIDRDCIVQRANPQYAKLVGRARSDLIGKHCEEVAPAGQRQKYSDQIMRRMSGETAVLPYQREYERPDGTRVALEIHEELLTNPSGQVSGMRMAAVDVTHRKRSDEQAFQAATELRALFRAFPDLFLHLDREGKIQEAKCGETSDPFFKPEKLLGRNLKEILPAEVQDVVAQAQVKRTKSVGVIEFCVELQPQPQTYEMRLLELDWEWMAILRNITGRKIDEAKLRGYAQELERKNEDMEAALTTAREATQLKGRFLATMSHEIRTPLNGVLGMTDLLLGSALASQQQEYAESIKRSATSLLSLINDFLDLSRIEAGKLAIRPVPFSLKKVLDETVSLFALQARGKGLEFRLEIAPNVPNMVVSDPERLAQVLNNLLGNAIKFTDAGRIGLMAILLDESEESSRVRFTVHDTGIGITHEDQTRIFERFTQADTSSTRKYGGTGLGLAISKELVELLGGEIGVESELDHGSRFWFTMELGKTAQAEMPAPKAASVKTPAAAPPTRPRIKLTIPSPAAEPAVSSPKPQAIAQTPGPKRDGLANLTAAVIGQSQPAASQRVLLAEDNEINQRITKRLIEKLGFPVDAVANGRQAVEAAGKKNYGLILMDCQMPEMDGFEATAVIRNRERNTRHTPICALTANAMAGDRERCLAAGMDDYITKPISPEKLQEAVDRWIRRAGKTSAHPTPSANA